MRTILILLFAFLPIYCHGQSGLIHGTPTLAYWSVGNKTETVIVLHGGPGAQHNYLRPEFDALKKVAKIIYYDQRGCGGSGLAESYTWMDHVGDLKRLIDTLSGNKKVILIGSSWGSLLGIAYSYAHPEDVKGLILSGTVPWRGGQMSPLEYIDYKIKWPPREVKEFKIIEKRIIKLKVKDGKENTDTVLVQKEAMITYGRTQIEPLESFMTAPGVDSLKKIEIPVLIFRGTLSTRWDWGNKYSDILPNAKLKVINVAGHDPWFSNPRDFFNECKDFIKKLKK